MKGKWAENNLVLERDKAYINLKFWFLQVCLKAKELLKAVFLLKLVQLQKRDALRHHVPSYKLACLDMRSKLVTTGLHSLAVI